MKVWLLIIAALLGAALVVQVVYARTYAANATRTTKAVWGLNIALLLALVLGLVYYAMTAGVR